MVLLSYKSLLIKENIDPILAKLDTDREKMDFLTIISKLDIRISIKPVQLAKNEYFYKIWIYKKKNKKIVAKVHLKQYFRKGSLIYKHGLSLSDVLEMIVINSDISDDFEEYCETHFQDPSDPICRNDYIDDLMRAKRFKRFLTKEDIGSIPSIWEGNENSKKDKVIDFDEESNLKLFGFSIIVMDDKKEYDKLLELKTTLDYYDKITQSYGFDKYTNEFNAKLFPVTKDDKQKKDIENNIDNYNQALGEYNNYLKYLVKKYKIRQTGNTIKRIAFNRRNDIQASQNSKFITAVIDHTYFY